ncbi:MAG: hypothetical protein K2N60_13250 [Oscillospiraceae bacterium]|nr:hypothetical protein [Oscillospiraceae bacterium]
MKKASAFISTITLSLAVTLTLSGCAEQKNNSGSTSPSSETGLIDDISVSEASAETAPSRSDALGELFDGIGSYAELCFGYTSDGKYEAVDYDEYISVIYAQYMASEEFYSVAQEYGEYNDMSYEEFKEEMYSTIGIDPSAAEKYSKYSMFVMLSYYGEDEDADHSAAARKGFDFFVQKLSEDSSFSADTLGENKTIYVSIDQQGDIISVSAGYEDKDGESRYILENELMCIFGDNYILVGTTAVPKDTKSLYISNSADDEWSRLLDNYNEEDYDAAVFDYSGFHKNNIYSSDEYGTLDLTEIAENLPNLKKLYISAGISVIGFEGIEKYDDFSELTISLWTMSEENLNILSGLSNIEKLHVSDIESKEAIEWAANAKARELSLECGCDEEVLKFIYTLPNVTELKTEASFTSEVPDLNGIEAMTNLKKLDIRTVSGTPIASDGVPDFAPLAGLTSLEELMIIGNNGINFDSIGKIKTLKSLTMYGIQYNETGEEGVDLSVFSNCTNIEYLDIYHVDKSLYSALPYMTNLKKIKFGVGSGFYYGLGEVANAVSLEEIIIENNDHMSLKGISNLTNLKSLTLTNCGFENISELGDCSALKTLIIDCKDQYTFDADHIENNTQIEELYLKNARFMHYKSLKTLTALKKLTLISTDLTEEQIDDLRKDMTWCEIEAVLPEKEKNEDGEEASETEENNKAVSFAEPLETVYIDNIRVETYDIDNDYYNMTLYIKNCGEEPLESLTEFMEENGLLDGCDRMNILYPAYDDHSEVTEILELNDKGIDYESSEVYLSVLAPYEEDYIENDLFRKLVPGCEARIIMHLNDDDSETK